MNSCKTCGEPTKNPMYCSHRCYAVAHQREVVLKNCLFCGKVFETRRYNREPAKFCSQACSNAYRRKKAEKVCKRCGKVFCTHPAAVYCSRKCYIAELRDKNSDSIKTCPICNKEFRRQYKFCSRECFQTYNKSRYEIIVCQTCGKEVSRRIVEQAKFCSKDCALAYQKERVYSDEERGAVAEMFREVFERSPHLQKGPQHHESKYWVIESPDGTRYEIINLLDWARKNANLFDHPDPKSIYAGFSRIKASALGKNKKNCTQYKGWLLIDWGGRPMDNAHEKVDLEGSGVELP